MSADKSSRIEAIQLPLIPVIGELIRANPGTISLGQGVVAYSPPQETFAYLSEFAADPENNKYQAVVGISALIEAIEAKLKAENGIQINQSNCIVVTAGSNMAFMNAILAIADPGDSNHFYLRNTS